MNYFVGDFAIQLKNASMARKKDIVTGYSNIGKNIAKVLIKEGFLDSVKDEVIDGRRMLLVSLRYQRRKPTITDITLVSRPSLRAYVGADEVLTRQGRAATAILSTSSGVMTGKEAVKKNLGGELLFKIW